MVELVADIDIDHVVSRAWNSLFAMQFQNAINTLSAAMRIFCEGPEFSVKKEVC